MAGADSSVLALRLEGKGAVILENMKPYGDCQVSFKRGKFHLDRSTGKTVLVQWASYSPFRASP